MTGQLAESTVEDVALAWLESLGYAVKHGPEIAPGELLAERQDYGQVVLEDRLRDTLLPKLISGELRVPDAVRTWERNV
jgi:hypothetical protein